MVEGLKMSVSKQFVELASSAVSAGVEVSLVSGGGESGSAGPVDDFEEVRISVPAGAQLEEPIMIRWRFDTVVDGNFDARLIVSVGAGAVVNIVEETGNQTGNVTAFGEFEIENGAVVTHGRLDAPAEGAVLVSSTSYNVHSDAKLVHSNVLLPGGVARVEVSPRILGRGAEVVGHAVALVGNSARAEFRVVEEHLAPDTSSNVDWRAVAAGNSKAVYSGLLKVDKAAPRVSAFESARALLLSKTARVETVPELEICNMDVHCSHGVAVAPIDEAGLFYLMSRGLPLASAKATLVEGFLEPIVGALPNPVFAKRVRDRLAEELAGVGE